MKYLLLCILALCSIRTSAQVSCVVDSIGIAPCVFDQKVYVIPVHVAYTGTPDSVLIEVTGLDYTFQPQYFRMFQHFINPSSTNTFNFPIYDKDVYTDSVDVKITLIGHTCNSVTDFLMETLIVDDPICFCQEYYVLSGQLNEDKNYIVSTYIESSQEILTGNNVLYSAKTHIELTDGFVLEDESILEINHIGCDL